MPQTLGEALGERFFFHIADQGTSGRSSNRGWLGRGRPGASGSDVWGFRGVQAEIALCSRRAGEGSLSWRTHGRDKVPPPCTWEGTVGVLRGVERG